jgi:hypothetical protein
MGLWQDLQFAIRLLVKDKWFTSKRPSETIERKVIHRASIPSSSVFKVRLSVRDITSGSNTGLVTASMWLIQPLLHAPHTTLAL